MKDKHSSVHPIRVVRRRPRSPPDRSVRHDTTGAVADRAGGLAAALTQARRKLEAALALVEHRRSNPAFRRIRVRLRRAIRETERAARAGDADVPY